MKLLRTVLMLGGLAVSAVGLVGLGWQALAAAWADVLGAGPASLDQLVAAAAGTAVAGLAGWLAVGLVAATVSALCTALGRTAGRLALASRRAAPPALHRLVGALLGAGLVLGAAAPALAAPVTRSGSSTSAAALTGAAAPRPAGDLDPTWTAGTHRSVPAADDRIPDGWTPDGRAPGPVAPADRMPGDRMPGDRAPGDRDGGTRMPGSQVRAPLGAEVVVRRGDTLWDLAARHLGADAGTARIAAEWPRWYAANRAVIGPDPDRLEPGQRLRVPGAEVVR